MRACALLGALAILASACVHEHEGVAPPAPPPPPPPAPPAPPRPRPALSARCANGQDTAERVEVALHGTVRTRSNIAVTFAGVTHDSYDDGSTDTLLHLVFHGVDDSGALTPSALTWMPSAFARPEWIYLEVDRCVRVVEVGARRVVLDVLRPP